jgi:Na+/H+-dicarboxylate symporter
MKNLFRSTLNGQGIDNVAERFMSAAPSDKESRKNVLRSRIFMEEAMARYQREFGEETELIFEEIRNPNSLTVSLKIKGPELDPFSDEEGEDPDSVFIIQKMCDTAGILPTWNYRNGYNIVSVAFHKKRSTFFRIVTALVSAVTLGTVLTIIPGSAGSFIAEEIFGPIYNSFNGIISFIAGPLIFLTVTLGVVSVGSVSALSRIGKRLLSCFFALLAGAAVVVFLSTLPFVPLDQKAGGMLDFSELYQMVLGILPSNIIAPFLNGNSLQIVCMAFFVGIAMLFMYEKVSELKKLVEQFNYIVQWLMILISGLVPVFIFISVFNLIVNGQAKTILSASKLFLMYGVSIVAVLIFSLLPVCLRTRVSPFTILKKNLPAALIGLTTASSASAYSQNIQTCRKELGISETVTNIGVSLGQTIYKPGVYLDLFLLGIFCAEYFSVPLSLGTMVSFALFCFILSVAAPPVPGGGLTCFTLISIQLGLPGEAVALMCTLGVIPDFLVTSLNMCCLQHSLVLADSSLGSLDDEILRKKSAPRQETPLSN